MIEMERMVCINTPTPCTILPITTALPFPTAAKHLFGELGKGKTAQKMAAMHNHRAHQLESRVDTKSGALCGWQEAGAWFLTL